MGFLPAKASLPSRGVRTEAVALKVSISFDGCGDDSEPMATLRSGGLTKGWGWWREERENPAVVGEDERGACR